MEPLNDRVLNEIRKYETELLPSYVVTGGFAPLHWWGQHEQSNPLLSDCAKRLLVIPTSSAEYERHFSRPTFNARHITRPTSQRDPWPSKLLFPETVEVLSILLERYKNKLLNLTVEITFFIARQHTDARYWYSSYVRLSIRLSVRDVPVSDENGLAYCRSPIILVLSASNSFTKFHMV